MISPHTPPGTKVVCIRKDQIRNPLVIGETYTVRAIVESRLQPGRFLAQLWEVDHTSHPSVSGHICRGYYLHCFRKADLPRCLTELLEPVHLPREALV